MTSGAERDQIALVILAGTTAKTKVVDLQLRGSPAALAAPAVALKHLLPEASIGIAVEPDTALSRADPVHEAALM